MSQKSKIKIQKGLYELRIYRCAPCHKLLRLNNAPDDDMSMSEEILESSLFFTTQKNMALEYRGNENPILLEVKGVDFLASLNKVDGVKVILLDHRSLATYQRIVDGFKLTMTDEQIRNFFQRRTFSPAEISLRNLRRSCEIIVLLPEGINKIAFRREKRRGIKCLIDKCEEKGREYPDGAGNFHRKLLDKNTKPDKKYRRLIKKIKRLRKKKMTSLLRQAGIIWLSSDGDLRLQQSTKKYLCWTKKYQKDANS